MSSFERVAQIIRYLDQHRIEQPSLDDLARALGGSRFHLQRLFAEWAGISPKQFLQCLTLADARERLRQGQSVLAAALDAGLSGPGRLHDLCVHLEAASPGEVKSGGAGWTLAAGFADSPFGGLLVAEGPRGICHLTFPEAGGEAAAWQELLQAWPGARLERNDGKAAQLSGRIFQQTAAGGGWRAWVKGTAFQVRVWRALITVPPGALISYGQLAERAGLPSAARAVGSAVGANPISYLIPCHRVIRQTGILGNYRWGAERKRVMLVWEAGRSAAARSGEPGMPKTAC